jgi:hypothetical protein
LSSTSFSGFFKQKKPWRISRKDCYSLLGWRIEEPRPTVRRFLIAEILAFIPSRFFLQHPPVASVKSSESESVAELPSYFCYKSDSFINSQEPRNLVFIRKNITLLRTIPNGRKSQKA